MNLAAFSGRGYDKGRSVIVQTLWLLAQSTVFQRWWMPNAGRIWILRRFGATVGSGVLIRHCVRIHWPWKLFIGDNSWVGEGAWILNLEDVHIGSDVCISQEVLLCTGSHDWRSPTFEFDNAPITIGNETWLAARCTVLRGVTVGHHVVIRATALVTREVPDHSTVLAAAGVRSPDAARLSGVTSMRAET